MLYASEIYEPFILHLKLITFFLFSFSGMDFYR